MIDSRPPRGLASLLAWFRAQWEAEIPDDIHVRGVWHDREASSALGAPALSPGFSAYLMGSPRATDYDPRLDVWTAGAVRLRPMHAVLDELAGRDEDTDAAFRAKWLFRVACMGWDVTRASDGVMPPQVANVYTHDALERAWRTWRMRMDRQMQEAAA